MHMLDDVGGSKASSALVVRLHLVSELGRTRKDLSALSGGSQSIIQRLKLVKRSNEIRKQLGAGVTGTTAATPLVEAVVNAEPKVGSVRRDTAHFYEFHEKRTRGQRQKANNAAIALVDQRSPHLRG